MQHGVATRSGGDTDPLRWFRRGSHSRSNVQNQRGILVSPTTPNSLLNIPPMAPRLEVDPPYPRAETPSGSDYGHIGAFKLGSLRITNGAASPAPSDIPTTVCGDEEYVSASEGRRSLESDNEDMAQTDNADTRETVEDSWKTSSDSTPRQRSPDLNISTPEKQASNGTHLPLQEFALFKFTDSPVRPETPSNRCAQVDALSPLSLQHTPPVSPSLQVQATSKHMAVEDDLFEPESQTTGEPAFRMHGSFDSGYHGLGTPAAVKINPLQEFELRLLAKSDSGYSSNMSVRSCKSNPTVVPRTEGLATPSQAQFSMLGGSPCSSVSGREARTRSTSIEGAVAKASAVSYLTVRPRRFAPSSRKGTDASNISTRSSPPISYKYSCPDMSRAHASRPPSRASSRQASRALSNTSADFTSTGVFPSSNATSRWRSSSKPRPRHSSQPIFTVQAASSSEQLKVPPVPTETAERFEQRSDMYPVVRFPNFGRESSSASTSASSDEALERVFSDRSTEFGDEVPCVPVNSPIQDGPDGPVGPTAPPTMNKGNSLGIYTSSAGVSTDSEHQSLRPSLRDENLGFRKKAYHGLGSQDAAYSNDPSHPDAQFERGRKASRETPPLHSFERSIPRRYYSSDLRPRCPSCGPSPQAQEWFSQRSYSMVSQYPNPQISSERNSPRTRRARQKSLPPLPVSMRTQDRMQASHMALHAVIPPVTTLPFPRPEDRMFDRGPQERQASGDSWRNQRSSWTQRRSIDSQRRPRSARPSMEFCRPQPQTLNYHLSFDMRPRDTSYESETYESAPQVVGWERRDEGYDNGFGNMQWEQQDPYDEPHGTYYYSKENKSPIFSQHEVECNKNEDPLFQQFPGAVHWRGTPATSPLVPDGFAGDVPDRYEADEWDMRQAQPKRGRRSFRDSHAWGVAMNAVPALLQKVKITKS